MIILHYTPTWEGFLTALFEWFDRRRKGEEVSIKHPDSIAATSLFPRETVGADSQKARRVEAGMKKLSKALPEILYTAWLSETQGVEEDIAVFLKLGFDERRNPWGNLTDPLVRRVDKACRKTGWERQRMLQFVRFVQTPEGIYVADIEPNSNVLSLIGEHFHHRFNDQPLLIRDLKRRLILVSSQEGWHIQEAADVMPPLPADGLFEDLWRGYFHAISNPARKNLKLQQSFVPLRYRKHLTEFQEISR